MKNTTIKVSVNTHKEALEVIDFYKNEEVSLFIKVEKENTTTGNSDVLKIWAQSQFVKASQWSLELIQVQDSYRFYKLKVLLVLH